LLFEAELVLVPILGLGFHRTLHAVMFLSHLSNEKVRIK
jgi:hypothetical protein